MGRTAATVASGPASGVIRAGLDWLLQHRDRLLADPAFQRFATRFPATRWIARRRSRALFDLCAGFVYSQVLLACVRLQIFDLLAAGPIDLDAIAAATNLPHASAERLVLAAVSLGLLERRGRRYGLGQHGAALRANPGVLAMVEHHSILYGDLSDPVALLRGEGRPTALQRYWAYARSREPSGLGDERVGDYTDLMAASQQLVAAEILDAFPLSGRKCLLDVGGGDGTFLRAVGRRWPDLGLVLLDLPAVADRARMRFAADGLSDRAEAVGGDFIGAPLPRGCDTASLVRVIHDHDDDRALTILRRVKAALEPGGLLLLAEPMAGESGVEQVGDAYFGFYLLAMGQGRARTSTQLQAMLADAGFASSRIVSTRNPLLTSLIVARSAL